MEVIDATHFTNPDLAKVYHQLITQHRWRADLSISAVSAANDLVPVGTPHYHRALLRAAFRIGQAVTEISAMREAQDAAGPRVVRSGGAPEEKSPPAP